MPNRCAIQAELVRCVKIVSTDVAELSGLGAKMSLGISEAVHRAISYAQLAAMSDESLMAQLKEGNGDALAVLFDRYHRLVVKIAIRILRDAAEAEDLMQTVFLEIFRSASQFDPARGTAKIWLLQCVYHRGFNRRHYLNLRGIYLRPEEPASASTRKEPAIGHNKSLNVLESARAIKQALKHLNKAQRTAVELAYYEGLTMHEIAERTGESFDSVRHHYYRGLEKLRSVLCRVPDAGLKSSSAEEPIPHVQS
jgi:RNA polymerase sigma-70 factor, ECF subfamily